MKFFKETEKIIKGNNVIVNQLRRKHHEDNAVVKQLNQAGKVTLQFLNKEQT